MNKKNDFIIDVISEIDDKIVDKALTKRFKLWAKKGKSKISRFVPVMAAAACACIIFGVLLYILLGKGPATSPGTSPDVTPDGKQIPIYKGMTVSNEAPPSADSAYFDFENAELEFLSAPLYEQDRVIFINDETDSDNTDDNTTDSNNADDSTTDSNPSENNGSSEDSSTPEVFGGTYYALKNEDIYIHVHLSNPDEFEILSFTLNGKKYSSNMFEYGSDLERLILKYNVGDVDGLQEYTIDAIKYIDGDKIKDVRMDGDRTVKVYVNDDTQMLNFGAELVGFELVINPIWSEEFTGEKKITSLSLWKGEEKLRDLDTNTTIIDGLPTGERLILKATYNDGGVEKTAQYIFDTRKQSEGLSITNGVVTGIGTCTDTVLYIDMPVAKEAFIDNKYVEEIYFGSGVTYINGSAFSDSKSLKKIVCYYGIKEIGNDAFHDCANLSEVIIPEGVENIGEYAFSGCVKLSEIIIPESVENIGQSAFAGCMELESITLPSSLLAIRSGTFGRCDKLSEIIIPESVETIEDDAFAFCVSLKSITIPNSVTSISGTPFIGCSGITSITLSNSLTSIGKEMLYGCYGLTSITIPNSVTSIEDYAFCGCSGLTSITIPNSVTSIEDYAFGGCTGLTSINIPNGVTSIGNAAFADCTGLTSINIPNSVTSIGNFAFSGCSGLTSIAIPNSVTSIEDYAFSGCSGLKNVTIPNSVTSIGEGAFKDCTGLKNVTIPNSVTSIGEVAFRHCTGLESVTIPNSVTSIGYLAFRLTSIKFQGTKSQWQAIFKESFWNDVTGSYTVYCSNGNITK